MRRVLRDNAVLVLGVLLPVLLIAALLAIRAAVRLMQEPPAFPVAYASFDHYYGRHRWWFDVDDDGRLGVEYLLPDTPSPASLPGGDRIIVAVYDAASDRLSTFDLDAPDDAPPGERIVVDVPATLRGMRFDDSTIAPDGYRFESGGRRGGGLFSELLGAGSRRGNRLVGDGVPYRAPEIGSSPPNDRFIGWIVDGF